MVDLGAACCRCIGLMSKRNPWSSRNDCIASLKAFPSLMIYSMTACIVSFSPLVASMSVYLTPSILSSQRLLNEMRVIVAKSELRLSNSRSLKQPKGKKKKIQKKWNKSSTKEALSSTQRSHCVRILEWPRATGQCNDNKHRPSRPWSHVE